jgi:hypothetical protein
MTEEILQPKEQPYIKLTKNRSGYTWDIKMIGLDVGALKAKNEELMKEFDTALIVGSKNGIETD